MLKTNTIYCSDCLELMKEIDSESIDMILCDLPYGITARNKWDVLIPFNKLWNYYERIIKINGAIVLTAAQPFTSMLVMSNKQLFRYSLVWKKTTSTGFLNANKMPLRAHEDRLVFYKSLPTYNPQKTTGHLRKVSTAKHKINCKQTTNYRKYNLSTYDSIERYPVSVLIFATDKQKQPLHPTQKPLALFEYLIKTYTNENDLILDNCIGSGTTAVAALKLKRNFIGIDSNIDYCKIAYNRIAKLL